MNTSVKFIIVMDIIHIKQLCNQCHIVCVDNLMSYCGVWTI